MIKQVTMPLIVSRVVLMLFIDGIILPMSSLKHYSINRYKLHAKIVRRINKKLLKFVISVEDIKLLIICDEKQSLNVVSYRGL